MTLFPSVLCSLIKTELSLSLQPPQTVLGHRTRQGAGDQFHVCLVLLPRVRSWPLASNIGPATADPGLFDCLLTTPSSSWTEFSCWWGLPGPANQAGAPPPKAGALPWQPWAKLMPRQGKYTSLSTPTHTPIPCTPTGFHEVPAGWKEVRS